MAEPIPCPFCMFCTSRTGNNEYQIMLHMESQHPEGGESPLNIEEYASDGDGSETGSPPFFTSCPIDGCGEAILISELSNHLDLHDIETQGVDRGVASTTRDKMGEPSQASFDTKLHGGLRSLDDHASSSKGILSERQANAKGAWKELFKKSETSPKSASSPKGKGKAKGVYRRLGKSELGPHANENKMPAWLVKLLERDGEVQLLNRLITGGKLRKFKFSNHAEGILPVIVQLFDQAPYTQSVYLCHPSVKHVSKLRKEGGFCGYRNIQMLTSYINGVESQGYKCFNGKIPTIFQIQDHIEHAWDQGINSQGRIETGGIRGTRKYIGTPEAQAMFCSLGISCDAQAFKAKKNGLPAYELLFEAVENYFANGCTTFNKKIRLTSLPPMYFQHQGHSMTIVGIERRNDGSQALIVFDPMFHDPLIVAENVGQVFDQIAPVPVLSSYRRGPKYLGRYKEFEILKLTPPDNEMGKVITGSW